MSVTAFLAAIEQRRPVDSRIEALRQDPRHRAYLGQFASASRWVARILRG